MRKVHTILGITATVSFHDDESSKPLSILFKRYVPAWSVEDCERLANKLWEYIMEIIPEEALHVLLEEMKGQSVGAMLWFPNGETPVLIFKGGTRELKFGYHTVRKHPAFIYTRHGDGQGEGEAEETAYIYELAYIYNDRRSGEWSVTWSVTQVPDEEG